MPYAHEALICIANELAHVAESVDTVTWNEVAKLPAPPGLPAGPWLIPPQSSKDRFIARDLAIDMLANLALNDMWIPTKGQPNTTVCSIAYTLAAQTPSFGTTNSQWLFGVDPPQPAPYFPPEDPAKKTVTTTNMPDLVNSRLRFNTQVLRGAGRLLKELVEKSVEADLAGTAQRRARATDPARGSC